MLSGEDWESAGASTVTSPPPGAKALRHPHMCAGGATGCNASSAMLLGSELSVLKENGELDVIRYAIVGADHHLYIPRVDNWTHFKIVDLAGASNGRNCRNCGSDPLLWRVLVSQ